MRLKKEVEGGSTFLRVPIDDAVEIILFVMFLAAVLGAVFKERFLYLIFAAIVIFILIELRRFRKEKMEIEKKVDKEIEEYERKKAKRKKRGQESGE